MNEFVESPEFQAYLKNACKMAFSVYGKAQTKYETWQDLQTDVYFRALGWLPRYRGEASLKTVLTTIARNLLVDAIRWDQAAKRRRDLEVGFTEQEWDALLGTSGEEVFYEVLVNECIEKLSPADREFYEASRKNLKMEGLGEAFGTSALKVSRRLKRIIKQIEECCIGKNQQN